MDATKINTAVPAAPTTTATVPTPKFSSPGQNNESCYWAALDKHVQVKKGSSSDEKCPGCQAMTKYVPLTGSPITGYVSHRRFFKIQDLEQAIEMQDRRLSESSASNDDDAKPWTFIIEGKSYSKSELIKKQAKDKKDLEERREAQQEMYAKLAHGMDRAYRVMDGVCSAIGIADSVKDRVHRHDKE